MKPRSVLAATLLIALLPVAVFAQSSPWTRWAPDGAPATATTSGYLPVAISDGHGGSFVVWCDYRYNGSMHVHGYLQHLCADGTVAPGWPAEGALLCGAPGMQRFPVAIPDGGGGVIVAWQDYRSGTSDDIYAQRVTASGAVAGGWPADGLPICTQPGDQRAIAIVSDDAGGAIVAWQDGRDSAHAGTYAQRVSPAGAALWATDGALLSAGSDNTEAPALVSDGEGGAIAAWNDFAWGSSAMRAQSVDATGAMRWGAGGTYVAWTGGTVTNPGLVTDGAHGAIASWLRTNMVCVQRLRPDGTTMWPGDNGNGIHPPSPGHQWNQNVIADGRAGVIVAWENTLYGNVWVQRVDGSGAPLWGSAGILVCAESALQQGPVLSPDGRGGAVVAWEDWRNSSASDAYDNSDVYAQWIDGAGAFKWPAAGLPICLAPGNQIYPQASSDGSEALIAWLDRRDDGWGAYAQRLRMYYPQSELAVVKSVAADPTCVRITWRLSRPTYFRWTVVKGAEDGSWHPLVMLPADSLGDIAIVDRDVTPGRISGYALDFETQGLVARVNVIVPVAPPLALKGLRPDPGVRDALVAFTLTDASPARLELLDLAGRRIVHQDVGTLGFGDHVVNLSAGLALAPGVYVIRLSQNGRSFTRRAVMLR
jgi:hypothetical protein